MTQQHLIFYDGQCAFCDSAVRSTLAKDKKSLFLFAPLQGETAKTVLRNMPPRYWNEDTLILVENYGTGEQRFYILGKGALRILWLLGWPWLLIGWISFLPSFLYDWIYRFIARHRKKIIHETECPLPPILPTDRFLP